MGVIGIVACCLLVAAIQLVIQIIQNYNFIFMAILALLGIIAFGAILHYSYIAIFNLVIHIKKKIIQEEIRNTREERDYLGIDKMNLIQLCKKNADNEIRKQEIQLQINEIHKKRAELSEYLLQCEDKKLSLKPMKF